jgi:hypothetical protein
MKVIEQLRELYFIQLNHYLIQYKDGSYGQFRKGETNKAGTNKYKAIIPQWHFEKHLQGEFTVGTFAKAFSKFITFDVDFQNKEMAIWMTYKIINTLNELGLYHVYISYSGSKGYHIDLFVEDLIHVEHAEKFFNYVLDRSDVRQHFDDGNKIEFRPSDKLGIKIPLGYHQKTKNYCGFCRIEDGLKVMSPEQSLEYLFTIQKIKRETILDIIDEAVEPIQKNKIIETEQAISQHKPLHNYEQSEDYSIERAQDLLLNGLKVQGSRHNTILLIGLYLKYCGYDLEACKKELYAWMEWQNPNTYTTPINDCYKDIDQVVADIYDKNYSLTATKKDLAITYEEIKWIIEKCPEKNQKLITYAMLIHSKRHANKQGVFYMPFRDIQEATGLYDQAVQRQVNKLIGLKVIEVVERNRKPKGKGLSKKLPNLYRLNIKQNTPNVADETVFKTESMNNIDMCLRFYFTDKELKVLLPRRQYQSLVG